MTKPVAFAITLLALVACSDPDVPVDGAPTQAAQVGGPPAHEAPHQSDGTTSAECPEDEGPPTEQKPQTTFEVCEGLWQVPYYGELWMRRERDVCLLGPHISLFEDGRMTDSAGSKPSEGRWKGDGFYLTLIHAPAADGGSDESFCSRLPKDPS